MSGMSRAELLDAIESIQYERDQARVRIVELEQALEGISSPVMAISRLETNADASTAGSLKEP